MVQLVDHTPRPSRRTATWLKRLVPVPVAAFVVTHPAASVFIALGAASVGILGLVAYDSVRRLRRPLVDPGIDEHDEHEVA